MLIVQNRLNPSVVIDALDNAFPAACNEIFVASAYTTREGVRLLFDRLRLRLGEPAFSDVPKCLVTTFDYGLTDANAIDDWIAAGGTVRIANAHVIQAGNLMPAAAFHPKVYSFKSPPGDWKVVTGSANLTGRGLTINAEAMIGASVTDVDMRPSIARLREGTVRADPALLAAYRLLKAANPPPASMAPLVAPVPQPPVVAVNGLSTLSDAIALNGVTPGSHQRFWVQTLSMSGGSGSQLELPRGVHSFFGFAFGNYAAAAKVTIGQPRLVSGSLLWANRILSWHGNNGMERLNMPTPAMSGLTYGNSAVSFRRRGADYEFVVAPWNSGLAKSWRAASLAAGQVYKVGANSPRLCGLI